MLVLISKPASWSVEKQQGRTIWRSKSCDLCTQRLYNQKLDLFPLIVAGLTILSFAQDVDEVGWGTSRVRQRVLQVWQDPLSFTCELREVRKSNTSEVYLPCSQSRITEKFKSTKAEPQETALL